MRISILEKREDFYKILKNTLLKTDYFKTDTNFDDIDFFCNKYLNFIATKKLPTKLFKTLVNEYSNSLTWWKRPFQKIYVYLATSTEFRGVFSDKKITLPNYIKDYLILGGNHRLRLFSFKIKGSLVLLKNGENANFILKDIFLRTNIDIDYAPKITKYGKNWYIEDFVNGKPINRLKNKAFIDKIKQKVTQRHYKNLVIPNKEQISFLEYKQNTLKCLEYFNKDKLKFIDLIKETFDRLFKKIKDKHIPVSWSHGDFQSANVLVTDKEEIIVIDWEATEKRYIFYDMFVIYGNIRSTNSFRCSFDVFCKEKAITNLIDIEANESLFYLLAVEELKYNIEDKISDNFYSYPKSIENLCHNIIGSLNI